MKNFGKIITGLSLAVFFLFSSAFHSPTEGTEPGKIVLKSKFAYGLYAVKNSLKIRLAFENEAEDKIKLRLYDQDNNLVHSDILKNKSSLKRSYDVSKIGQGTYRLVIEAGDFSTERSLTVGSENTISRPFSAYVSPKLKDGKLTVAFQDASEEVYLKISDSEGTILYSEYTTAEMNYARRFDFSRLKTGTYNVALTSGGKTIEKIYAVK